MLLVLYKSWTASVVCGCTSEGPWFESRFEPSLVLSDEKVPVIAQSWEVSSVSPRALEST